MTDSARLSSALRPLRQCDDCGCWTSNPDHICVRYDGPACPICGAGTIAGFYGAPGVGRFETCANGHELGEPARILTLEETR